MIDEKTEEIREAEDTSLKTTVQPETEEDKKEKAKSEPNPEETTEEALIKKCNKLRKFVIIQGVFILVCALIFCIIQFLPDQNTEHELMTASSPSGNAGVTLYEVGSPWFFGSSTVRIYYSTNKVDIPTVVDTEISNDGAALSSWNYDVNWEDDVPVITFRGEEQHPVTIRLEFPEETK